MNPLLDQSSNETLGPIHIDSKWALEMFCPQNNLLCVKFKLATQAKGRINMYMDVYLAVDVLWGLRTNVQYGCMVNPPKVTYWLHQKCPLVCGDDANFYKKRKAL